MLKKFINSNSFLIGVCVSVSLAWLLPQLGSSGGLLWSEITTKLGVFVIFIIQGLPLPTNELRDGLFQWRLHLFCQGSNYLLLPLLGIAVLALTEIFGSVPPDLRVGFLYLAILPTTVSTAIVFTGKAGGNVVGALFNTSVSNVLGVFIVPIAATWIIGSVAVAGPDLSRIGGLLFKITSLILLPLILGQILRIWLKSWATTHKKKLSQTNVYIIYYMIYAAFCNSFVQGVWQQYGIEVVGWALGMTLLLLALGLVSVFVLARVFRFNLQDQATALFCGSQKTLASGVPMAGSIFTAESPALGIVLLPLMFYHPIQILVGGYLIGWFGKRTGD